MSDHRTQTKRHNLEKSYHIDIDRVSQRHLNFFIQNELDYYNGLINNVTMRLRAFPESVASMRDGYGRLWSALAYTDKNFRELVKIPVDSWPLELRNAVPTSCVKNGKIHLNDKQIMLFDALSVAGKIHPVMRRNIANELLSAILPQADQLIQGQKNTQGQMKDPVHMLVPHYYPERRHLQLGRDLIKIKYNNQLQQSEIIVPYTDKPLVVKDQNLSSEKWDIMIIRQQPNVSVNDSAPWQVDLMITSHRYLLDFTDQNIYSKKRRVA